MLIADRLVPGQLDGSARQAFRFGACAALALALHEQTEWPLIAITDHHNVHAGDAGSGSALHWAVQLPDGRLLDVDGPHPPEELLAVYHGEADDGKAALGVAHPDDAIDTYVHAQGEPVSIELAHSFVAPLLERCSLTP